MSAISTYAATLTTPEFLHGKRVTVTINTHAGTYSVFHLGRLVARVMHLYLDGATFGTRATRASGPRAHVSGIVTTAPKWRKLVAIGENWREKGTRFTMEGSTPDNAQTAQRGTTTVISTYC